MKSAKVTYSVWFRTGGTDNFKWQYVLDTFDHDAAQREVAELSRMGYPAHYGRTAAVHAIGLPETFAPHYNLDDGEMPDSL
jgi:hypothetical protein